MDGALEALNLKLLLLVMHDYKFIETYDGDPSVILDRRKIKSLESKKSLKPIYWEGNMAYQCNYLTLYLSEILINYLDNVARQ